MRTLILMRHGEAESRASSGRDVDRALTPRGRADAARAGAEMAAAGLAPDRALVSSARRTRETWSALAEAFAAVPVDLREALYDAPADRLLEAAQACGEDTVVVVAHNPGVADLAATLAGDAASFPPGSFAVLAWTEGRPALLHRWSPA